jgi:hypothetical protein
MAEIVSIHGKKEMSVKKTRGRPRKKKVEGRSGAAEGMTEAKTVEGHGMDRLRAAAERRVAESSEDLADLLLDKAMEGKLDSVKMLMKLAEEEKARKEEEKHGGENPIFKWLGMEKAQPEIGDVWIGDGWKNEETGEVVHGEWDGWKLDEWKDEEKAA